jgi:hypothetical protein
VPARRRNGNGGSGIRTPSPPEARTPRVPASRR